MTSQEEAPGRRLDITPVRREDLTEVGAYLHSRFAHPGQAAEISATDWARNLAGPWAHPDDTYGLQLRDAGRLVGVYVAYLSPERDTSAGVVRLCNLADWAVDEDYRSDSLRLVMGLVRKNGFYTDLTARPEVAKVNRRLGFQEIETEAFLSLNLPALRPSGIRVITSTEKIAEVLTDRARREYLDHRDIAGLNALAVTSGGSSSLVLYRRRHVALHRLGGRSLPTACILHVSNRELVRPAFSAIAARFLAQGLPLTWSDTHVVGFRPRRSRPDGALSSPRMYRGPGLVPADIDYLYSEVMFG